ncbi:MAG: TonB-dependent Receptor, partial [Mucilaginibacter sp.]|nr:TonB-dependent Receptor [Mucilaginibacter sp.]
MRKHLLFLLISLFTTVAAFAQNGGVITGKLLDAQTKEPLIGATVMVKGTTVAAAASLNGTFKLNAPAGSTTLVVSYIGYVSKEVAISGSKLGDILL